MVNLKQYLLKYNGVEFPYVIAEVDYETWQQIEGLDPQSPHIFYPTFEECLRQLLNISPVFKYCTGSYFGAQDMFFENSNQIWTEKLIYGGTHYNNTDVIRVIRGNVYNSSDMNNYVDCNLSSPNYNTVYINNQQSGDSHYEMFTADDFSYAQCGIMCRYTDPDNITWIGTVSIEKSQDGYSVDYFHTYWEQNALYAIYNGYDGDNYNDYPDPDDPYKDSSATDSGGDGVPDWNSDPITEKPLPPSFYGNSGLVSVFTPTTSELNLFSDYLWGNTFDLSSFKKIVNNPFDLIMGFNYIPFKTITAGTRSINVGNITNTGLTMSYPTQENYKHDFGSLSVNEQYKNFSDYAPHTRMKIHLPFIGTQEIDPDLIRRGDFNNTTVKLVYKYNIVNGTVCAYLMTANDKLLYQWSGNATTPIPVASNDYTNMYSGMLKMASGAVSGAVSGGVLGGAIGGGAGAIAGAGLGAVRGVSQGGIDTMASLKPTITTTGGIGASGAVLNATNDAYLIIEQPQITVADRFKHYSGLPRNLIGTIKEPRFYGYNEILSCRMGISNATEQEKIEIESILKSGYIYGDASHRNSNGDYVGGSVVPKPNTPSGNDLKLVLYQTNASNIRIDKGVDHLHTYTNIVLKDNTSIVTPTIKLRASDVNVLKGNYCYIPKFKRFYYVTDIRNLGGWEFDEEQQLDLYLWELDLKCDVLMSFRSEIINHDAIFTKGESGWNLYLNDSNIQIDNRTRTIIKKFPNSLTNDYTYVLLLAGA